MEVKTNRLPKKIRNMNKDQLIYYINRKLRIEYSFLDKLELEEIQYLLIQIRRYGNNWMAGGFLLGKM